MPIQVANPSDGLAPEVDEDDFHEFSDNDAATEYNFRELMDMVAKTGDLIITVPSDQVELLKQGLITRKARDNFKTKQAGLIPDSNVLAFISYQAKKDGKDVEGMTDVRVKLRAKRSVTVFDIRVPDDEL